MGSFVLVVSGNPTNAADLNQLINALNGASNASVTVQNTNTATPLAAQLATAPGSDIATNASQVTSDAKFRIAQYIRGADGYGGIMAGAGSTPTAHLYARSNGWKIDESLAIGGALSVGGTATLAGISCTSLSATGAIAAASFTGTASNANQLGGTAPIGYVQVGAGNAAATPLQVIIVGPNSGALPSAGIKGRVAIVVPFSLP
jgi:hypothetical protein